VLVVRHELPVAVLQFLRPGAVCVGGFLADPADLERVAVRPLHRPPADLLQLLGQEPVTETPEPELLLEQRLPVKRLPLLIRSVRSLRPVGDRVVHVELRVALAVRVLREAGHDEPRSIPPLPRRRRVMARADVSGPLLGHRHHAVIGPLHRSADLLGHPLGVRFAPLRRSFGRRLQE
jgi:hypothetical protein